MTITSSASENMQWLARVAEINNEHVTFDAVIDELLAVVTEITGLETAFVSELNWGTRRRRVVAARNLGKALVENKSESELLDSLCVRSFEDEIFWADDVATRWSDVAHLYDMATYVSVPIRLPDGDPTLPYGMLCATSSSEHVAREHVRPMFNLLAIVIAGRIASDRERNRAHDRAELAETFLQERKDFAAMSEHAMKGPLAIIDGWLDTLQDRGDELTPEIRASALDAMRRAVLRMTRLVEDLVGEAGAALVSTAPSSVLLHEVVAAVVADFAAGGPGYTVTGGPAVARADARGVVLVLEHLLENVRSHTPAGTEVVVEIRTEDEWAVMEVRDDGPGLPDGIDLFAPFTTGGTSSGLGLHVVRSVMSAMEGTVTATNAEPHGAVFTCRMPLG